ncbi:hypothetical protein [Bulleidia sp. zg-1006]|uniref:hypothetical protein n=1 Tax=Bulleidia sp. zg-1006 TaxID=2806552 RepID=UPI00193A8BB7|nr:hypothetical protein [Bulleidia sp. zg-1006]QRG86733.1 hypothetical protein JOS54_07800 [Bulleidia sp. zg-1006]
MKKISLVLLVSLLLVACGTKKEEPKVEEKKAETKETPQPKEEDKTKSLSPDEVTDFDRNAVTTLINQELRKKFGGDVDLVSQQSISFTKKDAMITAKGTYSLKGVRNGFEFQFQDKNVEYVLTSSNIQTSMTQSKKSDETQTTLPNEKLYKTYEMRVGSGISFTAKHSGAGSVRATAKKEDGKEIEIFNESGTFEKTVTTDLEAGKYTISVYTTGGSFSFNYHGK